MMADGATVLIRLKNAVFQWSGYIFSIFRLFRRPKRKNVVVNDKEGFPTDAGDSGSPNRGVADGARGSSEKLCDPLSSAGDASGNNKNRSFDNVEKNRCKNSEKNRLQAESIPLGPKNGTTSAAKIAPFTNNKMPNHTKNGFAGLQKNLRKICPNLDSGKKQQALNRAESTYGWVCQGVAKEDVDLLVTLPGGIDQKEWMASHVLAFFHHVNALYGSVSEFCTPKTCPVMNGKNTSLVHWIDEKGKKCKYPAQQYVDCVMSTVEKSVANEDSFPTKFGNNFPANFDQTVKKLFRMLYTVLDHLNYVHWSQFELINVLAQAKIFTLHFLLFAERYDLLDAKNLQNLRQSSEFYEKSANSQNRNCYSNQNGTKMILVQNLKLKDEIVIAGNLIDCGGDDVTNMGSS